MFRLFLIAGCLAIGIAGSTAANAAEPAKASGAPVTSAYSTSDTDIGTLLDNSDTKAVLDKHLPGFAGNPQIDMARSMTLKQIQGFSPDSVTDGLLAKIDADLAKLSARK